MDYGSILLSSIIVLIALHITASSIYWVIKHNKNGWAYGILPLMVGINVLAFSVVVLSNRLLSLSLDPIFLNYWSQSVRILTLVCFAIAIRMHLRYIKRINLSGDYNK